MGSISTRETPGLPFDQVAHVGVEGFGELLSGSGYRTIHKFVGIEKSAMMFRRPGQPFECSVDRCAPYDVDGYFFIQLTGGQQIDGLRELSLFSEGTVSKLVDLVQTFTELAKLQREIKVIARRKQHLMMDAKDLAERVGLGQSEGPFALLDRPYGGLRPSEAFFAHRISEILLAPTTSKARHISADFCIVCHETTILRNSIARD
ncbi:hypothetical protein SRABI121_02412 [Microbacterium sp. Bi121]|uniref:hypothetical protein n=1 Tax=Microbacterium sp. TaxID=51671 RepID=UPI001DF0EC49|nr:hypothetical protein [Microbacterium sp.]CAH0197889.1 hypothetical protein SRABI121_02412 [Microbacterium sp. Bi121]HWK76996.1 hypothetical protein [Microbacterium sp.]